MDIPPDIFPRTISLPASDISPAVKSKIWKLALTRTPNPNRSTSINFVHVNGRSVYIVDRWTMMVERKNIIRHVKRGQATVREGEMSGGYVQAEMCWSVRGDCCEVVMSSRRSCGYDVWSDTTHQSACIARYNSPPPPLPSRAAGNICYSSGTLLMPLNVHHFLARETYYTTRPARNNLDWTLAVAVYYDIAGTIHLLSWMRW